MKRGSYGGIRDGDCKKHEVALFFVWSKIFGVCVDYAVEGSKESINKDVAGSFSYFEYAHELYDDFPTYAQVAASEDGTGAYMKRCAFWPSSPAKLSSGEWAVVILSDSESGAGSSCFSRMRSVGCFGSV